MVKSTCFFLRDYRFNTSGGRGRVCMGRLSSQTVVQMWVLCPKNKRVSYTNLVSLKLDNNNNI